MAIILRDELLLSSAVSSSVCLVNEVDGCTRAASVLVEHQRKDPGDILINDDGGGVLQRSVLQEL